MPTAWRLRTSAAALREAFSVLGPLKRPLRRPATFVTDVRNVVETRGKGDRRCLDKPHPRPAHWTVRRSQDKVRAHLREGRHI